MAATTGPIDLAILRGRLRTLADPAKAATCRSFFKTGPGDYAEHDIFLGVPVPALRRLAKESAHIPFPHLRRLLASRIHEERMLAVLILLRKHLRGNPAEKERVTRFYLRHSRRIDSWDLVDTSAPQILGGFLADRRDRSVLDRLAASPDLWQRRIAVVATLGLIRRGELQDTFRIVRRLLHDPHDLIHKACGWMLREAGKRDRRALERFLDRHAASMPRTMLRYSLERLPPKIRKKHMTQPQEGGKNL